MAGSTRSDVLGLFQPDVANNLIRFAEHLRAVDADYMIFMARKSMRLYDVLCSLGMPRRDGLLLSDLALDMNPTALSGKKLALVDDTLIVGTSLDDVVKRIKSGISQHVSTHVFAQNRDWVLFEPDHCMMSLSDPEMMTFCAAEVRAMSALAIPYLLDFPFSAPFKMSASRFHRLSATFEWDGHCLSTAAQAEMGSQTYTFLPSQELLQDWRQRLGATLFDAIQIAKVRLFTRRENPSSREAIKAIAVPIVTMKPMKCDELETLFQRFVEACASPGSHASQLTSPKAHLRYVQYALSTAIGERFLQSVRAMLPRVQCAGFQDREAIRHFGPWMITDIRHIHGNAHEQLLEKRALRGRVESLREAPVPAVIQKALGDVLEPDAVRVSERAKVRAMKPGPENVVTDFNELFLDLFDKHEIPARKAARKYGLEYFRQRYNRLNSGISWGQIVKYLSTLNGVRQNDATSNVISLLLDFWNDLGVAVPLLYVGEGTITRVYRHGEDVKITNQELAFIQTMATAMMEQSGADRIPRILFEKALVCMFRAGFARDWIKPLYGPSGGDYVARVGYHLKGAVLFHPHRSVSLLAGEQGSWISSYCVRRGVLRQVGGQYAAGSPVEANFEKAWAPSEARKIGMMIGEVATKGGPLETFRQQAVFASCVGPRETAAALEAELDIIYHWIVGPFRELLRSVDFNDPVNIAAARKALVGSHAHEALFSARMKWLALRTGEAQQINQACFEYLRDRNRFMAEEWKSTFTPVFDIANAVRFPEIEAAIDRAANLIVLMGGAMLTAEMALNVGSKRKSKGPAKTSKEFRDKVEGFYSGVESHAKLERRTLNLAQRLRDRLRVDGQAPLDCDATWNFASRELFAALGPVDAVKEELEALTSRAFNSPRQRKFAYLVWYDVIGSTGERFGLAGEALEKHRDCVIAFRNSVSRSLQSLEPLLESTRTEIHAQNGTVESANDEKHIFVRGGSDNRYVAERIVHNILCEAAKWPDVNVRIALAPCSLFVAQVTKVDDSSEVFAPRFLHHWKRLTDQLKAEESEHFSIEQSILYVCGKELISSTEVINDLEVEGAFEKEYETDPEGDAALTMTRGWNIVEQSGDK